RRTRTQDPLFSLHPANRARISIPLPGFRPPSFPQTLRRLSHSFSVPLPLLLGGIHHGKPESSARTQGSARSHRSHLHHGAACAAAVQFHGGTVAATATTRWSASALQLRTQQPQGRSGVRRGDMAEQGQPPAAGKNRRRTAGTRAQPAEAQLQNRVSTQLARERKETYMTELQDRFCSGRSILAQVHAHI
ncbi:unnamed protein product, partial [Urochloa humidicola]